MKTVWLWLQGKKTILSSAVVLVLTAVAFYLGRITPAQAIQLLAFAGVAVGWGDKIERYAPQILSALQALAVAIADYKAGNVAGALAEVEGAGAQLLPAVAGSADISASGLHITGADANVATVLASLVKGAKG